MNGDFPALVGAEPIMTIDRTGEVLVARMGPRYDAFHESELASLEQELAAAVGDRRSPRVVLDLAKTEYFSSATIEVLFRVWRKMESLGHARMALAAVTPFCREIIATARLHELWPMFNTVEDAVADLKS